MTKKPQTRSELIATIVLLVLCFPIGLFLMWTKTNWNKKVKWGITGFLGFALLMTGISNAINPDTSTNTEPQQKSEISAVPTQTPTQKVIMQKTTPTPSDPCTPYYGTSQLGDCMKLQNAMNKGAALDHPLKANVTYDSNAVYITNTENVEWDQCTATVNESDPSADNFQLDGFVVNAGQTVTIRWADVVNNENTRFDYSQTKPYSIDLDCIVGGQTDKNTGAFSGGEHHRSMFNL